jgi:hypothetical protein
MRQQAGEIPSWRALYRVAHGLRYRELADLIGHRITITSMAVEDTLRGLASRWLMDDAALRAPGHVEGTLVKYGLIDAEFEASNRLLDHEDTIEGLDAMRACGFLPKRGEVWERDEVACGAAFAHELAEDLSEGTCLLKLMLQDDLGPEKHFQWTRDAVRHGLDHPAPLRLPPGYLPRELTVIDACATNASFVWFCKHLYL